MIRPKLHHVHLKTTRLQEMIDWYGAVIGAKIIFQSAGGASTTDNPFQVAFMTNDRANHGIVFMAVRGVGEDPEHFLHAGLHHVAFEYESFNDLMSSFARLQQLGIEPIVCINHGVTTSLYYSDPDQNAVELLVNHFDNWDTSTEWMSTSEAFRQNPMGVFFDPDPVVAAYKAGATFEQLQKDTYGGKYPPSKPLTLHLPPLELTRTACIVHKWLGICEQCRLGPFANCIANRYLRAMPVTPHLAEGGLEEAKR
jgi:catechol 2,3-dioxygenase